MNLYGVMLYDDLSEFPVPDSYVYLTRDAAQRRADRRTYEYGGVKYWATVHEVRCGWDAATFGPFKRYRVDWLRFVDYADRIRRERDRARAENARLRGDMEDLEAYDRALRDRLEHLTERSVEAGTERQRLRELARHLYECSRHTICSACPHAGDACNFEHDMEELGIELQR